MLPCYIVKDLLPSYLEQLTSPETTQAVEEHLASCEKCRAVKAAMESDICIDKAPEPRLNFIKRLKRKQIAGAMLSVLITVLCMLWFYGLEYNVEPADTASVKEIIREYIDFNNVYDDTEITLVDSIREKNQLMILYRLDDEDGYQGKGVVCFSRGILGKYRTRSVGSTTWALDSYAPISIGSKDYLVLCNVNKPVGASTVKIFADYHRPWFEGDTITELLSTTQPIYEADAAEQRFTLIPVTKQQAEQEYWETSAVYYDENGEMIDGGEIAKQYYAEDDTINGGVLGHDRSLQPLCFWLILILFLGILFVRYFLTV